MCSSALYCRYLASGYLRKSYRHVLRLVGKPPIPKYSAYLLFSGIPVCIAIMRLIQYGIE